MSYEYTVVNADTSFLFVKRALLYLAIILATIALALVVLLILFEKYLFLLLPAGMLILSVGTMLLIGRKSTTFFYRFSRDILTVEEKGGKETILPYASLAFLKNAEYFDFITKETVNLSFPNSRIIVKEASTDRAESIRIGLYSNGDKKYLLAFDDYALTMIRGTNDEV